MEADQAVYIQNALMGNHPRRTLQAPIAPNYLRNRIDELNKKHARRSINTRDGWQIDMCNTALAPEVGSTNKATGVHWVVIMWLLFSGEPTMKYIVEPRSDRALLKNILHIWPSINVVLMKVQKDDWRCGYISLWYQLWLVTMNDAGALPVNYVPSSATIPPPPKGWETLCWTLMRIQVVQQGMPRRSALSLKLVNCFNSALQSQPLSLDVVLQSLFVQAWEIQQPRRADWAVGDECCAVFNYAVKDGMKPYLCWGRITAVHDSEVQVKWNVDKTTDRCPPGHVHATEGAAFAASLDPAICILEPALFSAGSISTPHRTGPLQSPKRVRSQTTHTATHAPKGRIIGGPRPNGTAAPKVSAEPEPAATLQSESAILSPSTDRPRTRAQTAFELKPPAECVPVSNVISDVKPPALYVGRRKFEVPSGYAGSLVKDQEQINEWWKVIVSEKRTAEEVFLYLSPSNKKIARRLKREGGAALPREELVFIRFCGIYML